MKNIINTSQLIFTTLGSYVGWFLGGLDGLIYALTAFVVVDYITGLMVAALERKLSSEIGFRGIFKKILIFTFVGIGHIIDFYVIKDGSAVRTAVIFFYISNEGISIIENSSKIGLPIPEKLKTIFKEIKEDDSEIKQEG
ncbi:MAG: phage holin family protein [Firmicutes bacterium]|nr:phage holin family protein [Bacillota bacterium]